MAQNDEFFNQLRYGVTTQVGSMDAFSRVMQSDDLPSELPTSQFTFVFSGPPLMSYATGKSDLLLPVGFVQDIQYSAQRQMTPLPEVGNRYFRHVGGRTNHGATLSRIESKTANIIGAMYQWYFKEDPDGRNLLQNQQSPEGVSGHFDSLESDLLNIPFGLYIVKTTEYGDFISASFWERCLIAGISEQISSGQTTLMESMQIVMARRMSAPSLIGTGK